MLEIGGTAYLRRHQCYGTLTDIGADLTYIDGQEAKIIVLTFNDESGNTLKALPTNVVPLSNVENPAE
jgi:hypothetical protein